MSTRSNGRVIQIALQYAAGLHGDIAIKTAERAASETVVESRD